MELVAVIGKYKNVIIIILAVILGIGLGFIIYNLTNKNNVPEEKSFEDNLNELITLVNDINKIYESTNYSTTETYTSSDEFICQRYIGDDLNYYLDLLNKAYINPFIEDGYFQLTEQNDNDEVTNNLYVCKPQTCEVASISEYTIIEDEGKTIINFDGLDANLDTNTNKFSYPIVLCK